MIELKNTIEEVNGLLDKTFTHELSNDIQAIEGKVLSLLSSYNQVMSSHKKAQSLVSETTTMLRKDITDLEEIRANLISENTVITESRVTDIANLDNKIAEKTAQVSSLESSINELSMTISNRNKENDSLLSERTQLTSDIGETQGQLTNLKRMLVESQDLLAKANASKDKALNELNVINAEIEAQTVKLNRINLAASGSN